jgi:quercetin dioxygenase-like cupin family protein
MLPRFVAMLLLAIAIGALRVGAAGDGAQERPLPPGFVRTPVYEAGSVSVTRLQLAPGARETPHTHPYPMLVVVLSRSDLEMHIGGTQTRRPRAPGDLEFVAAGVTHDAANSGSTPLDLLVLAIKPDRVHSTAAPPPQPLPGLSRTSLLDNADVTVTRLEFEPDVRETVHTHPYDLLVVPLVPARMDMQVGDKKSVHSYAVGEAIFIPRGVPHAGANPGTTPFRVLGIAIK